MNQIGSYFEINKENIFHKGKSNCRIESCLDPNRVPLRDITHLYNKSNNNPEYEEKVLSYINQGFFQIHFRDQMCRQ